MQMNIMQLIKEGKIGDSLATRGGDRHKHLRYVFIKMKKNQVKVWECYTWKTIDKTQLQDINPFLAILTPESVKFNLDLWDNSQYANMNYNKYNIWQLSGFLSLNLLYGVWTRHVQGTNLIHIEKNGQKNILPYNNITFNWYGNMISTPTKESVKAFIKYDREVKNTRNATSRARYAQQKAERIFKKHRKDGTLDQWDPKDTFKLQNAQVRQQAIEAVGIETVLKDCPTVIIDQDHIDGRPYELIEIELPGISSFRPHWGKSTSSSKKCLYLKMTNPSTGEYHLEGVARKSDNSWDYIPEETVKGALAWRDGEQPERVWQGDGKSLSRSKWDYIKPIVLR